MSTITVSQLEGIPGLKRDRLMNSMLATCSRARRKCGGCPHSRPGSPSTCITLMKSVASKHRLVIIEAFSLSPDTQFTVVNANRELVLMAT